MLKKRMVEYPSRGHEQREIEYGDVAPGRHLDLTDALANAIGSNFGVCTSDLVEVEGESSYAGWKRLVINVGPVFCIGTDRWSHCYNDAPMDYEWLEDGKGYPVALCEDCAIEAHKKDYVAFYGEEVDDA